jgi:hypothetical protein
MLLSTLLFALVSTAAAAPCPTQTSFPWCDTSMTMTTRVDL